MPAHTSFGRRRNALPPRKSGPPPDALPRAADAASPLPVTAFAPVDQELEDWKQARGGFRVPWRQVYLMAGLCFGIASFVLPDTVSDAVEWALYIGAAISFFLGLRGRLKL